MNKLLNRANQKVGVRGAAILLLSVTLIGQLVGFLRYKMINANYPEIGPESTDAFFAAFKIPDFFFYTLAAGLLGVAFMPFLTDRLERGDRKGVWDLSGSLMNLLAVIMAAVGVIIFVFAEPLIKYIVAPGLTAPDVPPEQLQNAVTIMRLIAFNPLLFTISGVLTSTQQVFGRFFFFAIAPIFYNLSIIASIFLFRDSLGLVGLGLGALLGAVLQLLVVGLGVVGIGFKWRPKITWNTDFVETLRRLPPRAIDQGIDSINSIAETRFATRLGQANVTYYENAYILHTAPILLIGTAISTAAFPKLTKRLSQGRPDLFRKEFLQILRIIIWIIMPVAVVCYFARGYFARLISARSSPEVAILFGLLVVAILFRTVYAMISRWFYAQKDTKTPLFVSLFAIALNIFLAYMWSKPTSYGISGLALAQSVVAAVEVIFLALIMFIRDHRLFDRVFWSGIFRILSATGFCIFTAYVMVSFLPLLVTDTGIITLGVKLGTISLVTFLVYWAASLLFGLSEAWSLVEYIKKIILKPIRIS